MNTLDWLIVSGSILLLFGLAYWKGKGQKDTQDFFLARRQIPTWAACLSFVATEISALTIVGVPATAFRENWQYLQFFIGSAVARIFIAYYFIPVFYQFNCTTIYEFLRHRFGGLTQCTASIFFFITRLLASGVRLYAASLAIAVILGWSLGQAILLFTVVSILFIAFGGIKAIVWTNVMQALTFLLAGMAALSFLIYALPGNWSEIWQVAEAGGRTNLLNIRWNLSDPNVLWIAILNGLLTSMAAFGTDHEMMQRLLTVETRQASQKTLISTIFVVLPIVLLYLSIGTLLYVYYQLNPNLPPPENSDKILSHFITHIMPQGFKGLMLAAILMASIDSPLGSLTASFVTDIYRRLICLGKSERHYLLVSRTSVVIFGLILAAIAYGSSLVEGMLWFAFKIHGVTAGSLLGVFLLGLWTKRVSNRANLYAMVGTALCMGTLLVLSEMKIVPIGWSWLIVMGTTLTFLGGYFLGPALK